MHRGGMGRVGGDVVLPEFTRPEQKFDNVSVIYVARVGNISLCRLTEV